MENKKPLHWEIEPSREEIKKETTIKKTNWTRFLLVFVISFATLSFIRKQFSGGAITLITGVIFVFLSNKMAQSQNLKKVAGARKIYLTVGYALTISIIIFSIWAITFYFFNK